jgi:hypothetical protein
MVVFGPAAAQVAPQTVELAKVNVQKLAAGYRASKVIGSSVANNDNETIGKIDDLLVSSDGKGPICRALDRRLSRHGQSFGGGSLRQPEIYRLKFVLPDGTKEGLRMLPEFKYASEKFPRQRLLGFGATQAN